MGESEWGGGRTYNDFAIIVALDRSLRRQGEALADGGFDGGASGGNQVPQLVTGAHDKGPEGPRGELHKMDGDDAPGTLDAELFEKGGGHDFLVADEGVRVEKEAADDGDDDDGETAAEDLAAVAYDCAAGHGAEVGDDLGDRDGGGGEVVLVLDHEGVDVLGAVGHEVEARHHEHEVDEEHPVLSDGDAAFGDEGAGEMAAGDADGFALAEAFGFREAEAEEDEEDWRAGAEPVEGTPAVGGGVDETTRKCGGEQVAKGVALLEHPADDPSRFFGAIFQGRGCRIAVQSTHGNAEEGTAGQKLAVGVAEAGAQLQDDEEDVIDDEGPFSTIAIRRNTCAMGQP